MTSSSQMRVVDLKLHAVAQLPKDGSVSVRVGTGSICCTGSSFEGIAFLGAGTRLLVAEPELVLTVQHVTRGLLPLPRKKATAIGRLHLEGCDLEKGEAAWHDVDLVLQWQDQPQRAASGEEGVLVGPGGSGEQSESSGPNVATQPASQDQLDSAAEQGVAAAEIAAAATEAALPRQGGGSPSSLDAQPAGSAVGDKATLPFQQLVLRLSYCISTAGAAYAASCAGESAAGGTELEVETLTTPLPRMLHCYAHGGFMGLAVSMLSDGRWRDILQQEDPKSFAKADKLFQKLLKKAAHPNKQLGALMTCLENSPVLCAYGLLRSGCTAPATLALEEPAIPELEERLADEACPEAKGAVAAVSLAATATAALAARPDDLTSNAGAGVVPLGGSSLVLAAPEQQRMEPGNLEVEEGEESHMHGVFLSKTKQLISLDRRLEEYLASLKTPNRYGYLPIGLEWDLWINPEKPSLLQCATVDHGTAGQLVTQAITTGVACLKSCARKAGERQIEKFGVTPVSWMNALGHSINQAVNGDRNAPLKLAGEEEHFYRLHLTVVGAQGGSLARKVLEAPAATLGQVLEAPAAVLGVTFTKQLWDGVYTKAFIDSSSVVVQLQRTPALSITGAGCTWNHATSFWPLPIGLEKTDLMLEVRGDPAGIRRDKAVGMVRLGLGQLLHEHPELLGAEGIELTLPIGPKQQRLIHKKASSKGARGQGSEVVDGAGPEEGDSDEEGESVQQEQETEALQGQPAQVDRGAITVRLRLETVGVLEAAMRIGVAPAAAQTCLAMLSKPGGLYLDIKSAYSTPRDIQQFVSTLAGIGVHCKAVCSFQKQQLDVGGLADTVLFFHGMNGLENACDDGLVERGQFVLFNGASFLVDLKPAGLKSLPRKQAKEVLGKIKDYPIDPFMLRKYLGLVQTYGFAGGIYVQEPDAGPAGVSALAQLVTDFKDYFALGFAYGHLSGLGISFLDQNGRGFAAQQIVEEFAARKVLGQKVMARIKNGEHKGASLSTIIAWGHRVLYGSGLMGLREQRTFIILLSQVPSDRDLRRVVEELGGVSAMFLRFFEHYEHTTPLTLMEAGFNFNHTKDLVRLLRNRGVLAGLPLEEKLELARFFAGPQLRGYGLTWVLMLLRLRYGLHKFAKEGLLCLLESCTHEEYQQVMSALGGQRTVYHRLRGHLYISWHYINRIEDVELNHKTDPLLPAYQNPMLRYAALPVSVSPDMLESSDLFHFRDKSWVEQTWRLVRKTGCLGFTVFYTFVTTLATCFTFLCCCVGPRMLGSAARGWLGASAILAFIIFAVLLFVGIFLLLAAVLPDDENPTLPTFACAQPDYYSANQTFCDSTYPCIFDKIYRADHNASCTAEFPCLFNLAYRAANSSCNAIFGV